MQAIIESFLLVAIAEMGDKTQLLALILATRYRAPWTILAGITVATVFNHALAAMAGQWLTTIIPPDILKIFLSATFVVFGIWILIPDKEDDTQEPSRFGPFLTTVIVFFLAEMGDKTQLATVGLAINSANAFLVTIGSTLGLLAANIPAIWFGEKFLHAIPLKYVRIFACALFIAFAIWIYFT